jgi:hypothetical protein
VLELERLLQEFGSVLSTVVIVGKQHELVGIRLQ